MAQGIPLFPKPHIAQLFVVLPALGRVGRQSFGGGLHRLPAAEEFFELLFRPAELFEEFRVDPVLQLIFQMLQCQRRRLFGVGQMNRVGAPRGGAVLQIPGHRPAGALVSPLGGRAVVGTIRGFPLPAGGRLAGAVPLAVVAGGIVPVAGIAFAAVAGIGLGSTVVGAFILV